MIRLIAVAFALIVSTSAQAAPLAPLSQPDGMITQVREACGQVCTCVIIPNGSTLPKFVQDA